MISTTRAIAASVGMDADDLKEYVYEPGRTTRRVYAIGDSYYCTAKRQPKECGLVWAKAEDQFFALRAGTTLWIAAVEGTPAEFTRERKEGA